MDIAPSSDDIIPAFETGFQDTDDAPWVDDKKPWAIYTAKSLVYSAGDALDPPTAHAASAIPTSAPATLITSEGPEVVDWNTPFSGVELSFMGRRSLLRYEETREAFRKISTSVSTPNDRFTYGVPRRGNYTTYSSKYVSYGYASSAGHLRNTRLSHIKSLSADIGENNCWFGDRTNYTPFGVHPQARILRTVNLSNMANSTLLADGLDLIRYMWAVYNGEFAVDSPWGEAADEVYTARSGVRAAKHSMDMATTAVDVKVTDKDIYPLGLKISKTDVPELPPALPVKVPKAPDQLTRPNGEVYHARKVIGPNGNVTDVEMMRVARDNSLSVLLKGAPGTGKTALCDASLENLQTIECDASTEAADFIGSYVPTGHDTFEWQWGPLSVAAMNGWPLLVDEIAMCDPRELPVLYSAMDGRNTIHVTANPSVGKIEIKEGFYVVGACNPDVPGAVLSDALLSRFPIQIEVTTDYSMLAKLGVDTSIITVASNLAKQCKNGEILKAPQTRELLAFKRIKDAFGLQAALANFIGTADINDVGVYTNVVNSAFGVKIAAIKI